MSEEELLTPKRRGRPPKQAEPAVAVAEPPPLTIDNPEFLESMDAMIQSGLLEELTEEASADLEALVAAEAEEETLLDSAAEALARARASRPARDKFVEMRGGLYLPVRQRVTWMRGEPEPHPDWLIQTDVLRMEPGQYQGTKTVRLGGLSQEVPDVKGGYAHVRARVLTRLDNGKAGPIIGEGNAFERSEVFHDFVEKAETAAIGRALAAAGYGTEAAFEEGENLADAPLRIPHLPTVPEPPAEIKIEASAIPGVKQGGRQTKATQPQLNAIRDKAKELSLTPSALQAVVRQAVPEPPVENDGPLPFYVDDVDDTTDGANDVMGFLTDLSFEECGKVVLALENIALNEGV